MTEFDDARGVLYPGRLPSFHREPAPRELAGLVRWFWIPRWSLAPGVTSRQEVLPFPASNLVVEPGGVALVGPATGASHRDLSGTGWAVGALLRPAGIASLHPEPRSLRDAETPFDAPELHRAVAEAMRAPDVDAARRRAVEAFSAWALERLGPPDDAGLLANAMEDLIASHPEIVRVEQAADRLATSVRGVQRLARRYVGLPPLTVIRRYRLQEAAQRLREDPSLTIARVAADLGYADHAHLSTDFRAVLGFTPREYRSGR
jgi:AraC-like DNA-binding protein